MGREEQFANEEREEEGSELKDAQEGEELPGSSDEVDGDDEMSDLVVVSGYVAVFEGTNEQGDVIDPDVVVRPPKWLKTSVEKDDHGVKVVTAVPRQDLLDAIGGDLPSTGGSDEEDAAWKPQVEFPLEAIEIKMLRDILAEQKAKIGERGAIERGTHLLDKLDKFLNPSLFDKDED